jgi:hypothetical protein
MLRRRHVLRGAGGIAVALPFLELFGDSRPAQAAPGAPRRLVLFFHHQGTILRHWATPGSSPADYELGQILSPLEATGPSGTPWKDRCIFVYGVDNKIAPLNLSNGHNSSARTCLTANVYSSSVDGGGNLVPLDQQLDVQGHANGPSIDQELARRLQGSHPYASIDLAVGSPADRVLYRGKDDPVSGDADPQSVFDRYFAGGLESAEELERMRLRRLSVLDAVRDNFGSLRKRLGKADRERLDAHAAKISDLEHAIQNARQCEVPVLDPVAGFDFQIDEAEGARLQLDLLAMAMSCDLAPVGTIAFGNGHAPTWDWIDDQGANITEGYDNWHDMVHMGRNQGDGSVDDPGLIRGFEWYTEQFVGLLERLDATPEDDGTMLDNTAVLWMSEFGNGTGHNTNKLHIVLAGNLGADVATGRCLELGTGGDYDESDHSHNQVFVSLLNAFGYDDTSFGWQGDGVASGGIPL